MARTLWKGAITFGLVHIPVELYPAEERKEFKFSMLDKRDFSPVGYKRYSKRSGKEVEWSDVVKGYEYEKDQYVVLSDEDFRRANVKASQTIDIEAFVPAGEIPPQYFEMPYYLVPTERGQKVYALLRETLRSTNRVAVAQVVIRTAQHLAVVVPWSKILMLNTLRYADELRPTKDFALPDEGLKGAHVTAKEVDLAKRLIDDMTEPWKASEFKDTYHRDLMRRIEEKIKKGETKEITEPETDDKSERRSAQVIDLAALLKQSLDKGGARRKTADPRRSSKAEASGKAALRVVASRGAAKAPAKRKRA
ncbi:MAG: Ku protein [Pseudomonadota bacterium]|nr:Ku protein [Pseudomonadota bacterium]